MAGCGFDAAPTSILELKDGDSSHVIYGDDSIKDVVGVAPNSEASVALVRKSVYQEYKKNKNIYNVSEVYGIDDLPWSDQPSLAFCSGVRIGEDLVLTAGHCVENNLDCSNIDVIFNYEAQGEITASVGCKEIVKLRNDINETGLDYALIRLERTLAGSSVKLNRSGWKSIKNKESVYSLGYPLGSFKKKALGKIRKVLDKPEIYVSNLDVFEGNSGSPIFSAMTHELIGILSSGETDFIQSSEGTSVQVKRCNNTGCSGEFIIPIEKISDDLYKNVANQNK
ncbi:serine protease [Bdellovibrio bacteriovorus]|uniref:trypsin-like serine peptidase n=1 Tax=Bdellovibrio TaxID=958 RepID=UPI0035A828FF